MSLGVANVDETQMRASAADVTPLSRRRGIYPSDGIGRLPGRRPLGSHAS
jgi:hypothetical protein